MDLQEVGRPINSGSGSNIPALSKALFSPILSRAKFLKSTRTLLFSETLANYQYHFTVIPLH